MNPINRRISLVVLNDQTERAIRGETNRPKLEVQDARDVGASLAAP